MAFSCVSIHLGGLMVEVQTDLTYPDHLDDLCARSLGLFKEGVQTAKTHNIDITTMHPHTSDYLEEEDDE